jgi:DNA mismatch repair ATPase MutS
VGEGGEAFLDPAHPYARDLDLFGKGSVFELLCTARTAIGQHRLAEWLLHPAPIVEIENRQKAVAELQPRLDFREDLAVFGEDLRSKVHPRALKAWAESPPVLKPRPLQVAAVILAGCWILSMSAWAVWGLWELAFASSVVNAIFHSRFKARAQQIVPTERFAEDLELLAGVLARLEVEQFSAERLVTLQWALNQSGLSPSRAIGKIRRLVESLESRRNLLVHALDPFILWTAQIAFATERWRQEFGAAVPRWLDVVGEMEALTALSNYAYEHPADIFPEFASEGALFHAEEFAHPLLPEAQAVRNDLKMDSDLRLILISGPNMAGKSTFIRAVGVNAVLAQCGAPVHARRLRLAPLQVAASICILDSLQGGVSHFYAEITRIKLIVELTRQPLPVLFLFDELLSGTNSHDRRVGAEAVVKSLVAKGALGLVTTHDLALTHIVNDLAPQAANFHFEDHLEDGQLCFDYRLTPGVAQSSNALKLMRSVGLEV